MNTPAFQKTIKNYYAKSGRHTLPWRQTRDPYEILVSEIMLQQTQVARVMTKYAEFLKKFPTVDALAKTSIPDVLKTWQGLGYNRRALNLKRTAEKVIKDFDGVFPRSADELESLPGIGQSTRGAIMAFAFGIPTVFIETNIRAIYIHHFFKEGRGGAPPPPPCQSTTETSFPSLKKLSTTKILEIGTTPSWTTAFILNKPFPTPHEKALTTRNNLHLKDQTAKFAQKY